jgi:hypothetical protein
MNLEKVRKKLSNSDDPWELLLYQMSIDIEKLKADVKAIKWVIGFILAVVLTILGRLIIIP